MFQFLRKAIVPSSTKDGRNNLIQDEYRKKKLKENLLLQVKKLQKSHVGNESIVDRNDEDATLLCTALEAIFLHQLKLNYKNLNSESFKTPSPEKAKVELTDIHSISFWELLKEVTHNDVLTQLQHLVVATDVGLCRAWLRLALNDGLITSYLNALISDKNYLSTFYGPNAFLMDDELPAILKEVLQGILQFEFHLNYNSSKLDAWDPVPLQLAGYLPETIGKENMQASSIYIHENESSSMIFPISSASFESKDLMYSIESDINNSIVASQGSSINDSTLADGFNLNQVIENQIPIGNRLAGRGWSGWSSSFEEDGKDIDDEQNYNVDRTDSFNTTLPKDFGTLLMDYSIKNAIINQENTLKEDNADIILDESKKIKSSSKISEYLENAESEVVPQSLTMQTDQTTQSSKDLINQLSRLAKEQGLDKQNFSCMKCSKSIGLIFGSFNVCSFDGGYYCFDCHSNDEHILSARIIHNWDFRKYPVSNYNKVFLKKIDEEPLFHIDELNPALYDVVPSLQEVKFLRTQLCFIKGYVQTCRQDVAEDFRRRVWPRDYLCDDVHQYSIIDFVEVQSGQLAQNLKKIVADFSRHIYKCTLCKQKGFICEYCHDQTIIYPFQLDWVAQCSGCLSVFHKKCHQEKRCPKCVRVRLRSQGTINDIELKFSVTQVEHSGGNDIL